MKGYCVKEQPIHSKQMNKLLSFDQKKVHHVVIGSFQNVDYFLNFVYDQCGL